MNDKIARIGILTVAVVLLAAFPSAMVQEPQAQYTNEPMAIALVTWCFI